jgi:hypothetical protein
VKLDTDIINYEWSCLGTLSVLMTLTWLLWLHFWIWWKQLAWNGQPNKTFKP